MKKDINSDYKKRFMNGFKMLCNRKSPHTVWSDCMALFAITLANTCILPLAKEEPYKSIYTERENEYLRIINNYSKKEQKLFPQMFALIVEELEERPNQDLLGELYMMLQISNKMQDNSLHHTVYVKQCLIFQLIEKNLEKQFTKKVM